MAGRPPQAAAACFSECLLTWRNATQLTLLERMRQKPVSDGGYATTRVLAGPLLSLHGNPRLRQPIRYRTQKIRIKAIPGKESAGGCAWLNPAPFGRASQRGPRAMETAYPQPANEVVKSSASTRPKANSTTVGTHVSMTRREQERLACCRPDGGNYFLFTLPCEGGVHEQGTLASRPKVEPSGESPPPGQRSGSKGSFHTARRHGTPERTSCQDGYAAIRKRDNKHETKQRTASRQTRQKGRPWKTRKTASRHSMVDPRKTDRNDSDDETGTQKKILLQKRLRIRDRT